MDSTFSGTLLSLKRQLAAIGGALTLVSPSPRVLELLRQMGVDDFYTIEVAERRPCAWIEVPLARPEAFHMPLVIFFLSKIGLITSSFLRKNRRYALVVILIIAAIITPPDVISQSVVTIPLWILYEISIQLASRVEKEKAKEEKEEWS
jgi:Sec-independent protein secretion pathway component TatC